MTLELYEWFSRLSFGEWVVFSTIGNLTIFVWSVILCRWLMRRYGDLKLFESEQLITWRDRALAASSVALNSLVSIVGWWLWKADWITITHPGWGRTVLDVAVFLVAMDFGMYVFHRLAHHPWIYRWVHRTHHQHESVNELSLFVLHPFEVLGFGALMIVIMMAIPLSGAAVLTYLALNVLFGTIGHAGVHLWSEGSPKLGLFSFVGGSAFHGGHHKFPNANFGFYTLVWDILFNTLDRQTLDPHPLGTQRRR